MNKKPIYALLVLLMIPILLSTLAPASAWNNTETGEEDTKYEEFGPRADRLRIDLYANAEAEWDALEAGLLDITDWPITDVYYDRFTTPPQNESIEVKNYGAEFGLMLLDVNNNNNPELAPGYPNPMYPNPTSCVNMRQAIWHLTNREVWGPDYIGEGFYFPSITHVPPSFGGFSKPMANPYPYSPTDAIAKLMSDVCPADGAPDFPIGDGEYRYWDLNGNGVYDGGDEELTIDFAIRSDHGHRLAWGDALSNELNAVDVRVNRMYGPSSQTYIWWFMNKAAHLYTAGWSLGVDPDHVILWHSFFYWHPGFCYNTGLVNDTILDDAAWAVYTANTESEALTNCHLFQDRMAEIAGSVPWWSYSASKAVRRRYTGGTNEVAAGDGEDPYRGNYWDGVVNVGGYGCDSYFSFLNMHPRGFERGNCEDMTIRYAFKVAIMKSFNPIYAEWLWDWNVLGLMYDSLLYRNPYDLSEIKPWIAEDYEGGIYNHPVYGPCTKAKFTLRKDVTWSDGMPLTTADVFFTFVELDDILIGRGLPPPWWYSSVQGILSFSIIDAYNFEVLLDLKSQYALMWVGGNVILPKHIWKPIAEAGEPELPSADPNNIASGPWRFKEYVPNSYVLMVANKPGSTVTTTHAGSVPITSPNGFHKYWPFYVDTYVTDPPEYYRMSKLPHVELGEEVSMVSEFTNLWDNTTEIATEVYVDNVKYIDVVKDVGFNEKAHTIDWHYYARMLDYGRSWVHYQDLPGPMAILTYNKNLTIWVDGWFNLTLDGAEMLYTEVHGALTISIYRYYRVFDHEWIESCTWYPLDIEVSWHTIQEDIAGSTWYDDAVVTHPYKDQLLTPDIKVDIKDVAFAAKAFGSYPGHDRWSTIADLNSDYQIDIRDIAAIAKMFGWVG